MSTVAELWALQTTDLSLEAARRRLAEVEEILGETAELLAARQEASANEAELARWHNQQRTLETEVRDLLGRIRAAEQQLMSGRVRNPKELEGMQANVVSLKRRRSALEDEMLEAMIEVDSWQEKLAQNSARLAKVEAQWQADQAIVIEERTQLVEQLRSLATRFNHQWEAIAPQDKELYRDLRSRKAGRALAQLQNGTCQACGVTLPTSLAQQVRSDVTRVFCSTCGRLLHG